MTMSYSPSKTLKPNKIGFGSPRRIEAGFSNQTALILIAICYPLGLTGMALLISAGSQSSGTWTPPALTNAIPQRSISEQEARSVIEAWWSVRPRVFAYPYDASEASPVVAEGPLWTDLTKSDGPVEWLKNHNQYYTYQGTSIENVISFDGEQGDNPSMVVSVRTRDTLHGPGIYKPSSVTASYRYIFAKERGRWKIWNYERI